MTKVALGPRMWVAACVRGPKHAYTGTLLRTQLWFQRHRKCKFSAIMAEVWNESHIIYDLFQTPFFPTIISLTWYIFKGHRNPMGKIQDLLENNESKWSFS